MCCGHISGPIDECDAIRADKDIVLAQIGMDESCRVRFLDLLYDPVQEPVRIVNLRL